MRSDEVAKNNQDLSNNLPLNTDAGRQKAILSVLTDISETLAWIVDMYTVIHGREINPRDRRGRNAEQ